MFSFGGCFEPWWVAEVFLFFRKSRTLWVSCTSGDQKMKFWNLDDKVSFLGEVGRIDLWETAPEELPKELVEEFIKKRAVVVRRLKDFRKQQQTRSAWRKNRWKYMKGINKFHRTLRGKKFHRSIGRWLATRYMPRGEPNRESLELMKPSALKGLSSLKTHFYIAQDYYRSLEEDVEFQEFFDYALPLLTSAESSLLEDSAQEFSDEEMEVLLRLTDRVDLNRSLVEFYNGLVPENVHIDRVVADTLWKKSVAERDDTQDLNTDGGTYVLGGFRYVVARLGALRSAA